MKEAMFLVDNNEYKVQVRNIIDREWKPLSEVMPRVRQAQSMGYAIKFVSYTGLCEDELRQVAHLNKATRTARIK